MDDIRVGLIGAGTIANYHLKASQGLAMKVVAVTDINSETARQTADRWSIPAVYQDYDQMLTTEDLDAVFVCTPTGSHATPTISALHAGKHVFVEKPMDAHLAAATEMVRVAKASDRIMMVGLRLRFTPQVLAAQRIVEAGTLGRIYYAEATADRRRANPGGTFIRRELSGFGATADLGVYALDIALLLMGSPRPVAVTAVTSDYISKHAPPISGQRDHSAQMEVEDFAAAWIRFEGGARLVMRTSWCTNIDSLGGTYFLGEKAGLRLGVMEVKGPQDGVFIYRDESGFLTDVEVKGLESIDYVESIRREDQAFIEAVANGGPSPIDPEGVLLTNVIIKGIIDSAATGGREVEVTVPDLNSAGLTEAGTRPQSDVDQARRSHLSADEGLRKVKRRS